MAWALVTGASSGIGAEFCEQLATRGHNLVLVARNQSRLEDLAARLRNVYGVKVQVLRADLADIRDQERVKQRLESESNPIALLVNNAGFALNNEFLRNSLERETAGLRVMVEAVMVFSWAAGRRMKARGGGAIINVSSMVQHSAMGSYAAHKTWVYQFSDYLRRELSPKVQVLTVCPGTTKTAFFDGGPVDLKRIPSFMKLSSTQVVTKALRDLDRKQPLSVAGWPYHLIVLLAKLIPSRLALALSYQLYRNRQHL